ncbi:MAG: OmpA family protein [Pseudomonadota bacterium]
MKKALSLSLIASSTILLGCTIESDRITATLATEAGKSVQARTFGDSTAHNIAVMNGDLLREMAANLTRLFASEAPATINFAFNSSQLDETARSNLRAQAEWIKRHPNITFRVFGHTDKVGSNAFNRRLGQRRARAAVNYLVSQGVDRRKVEAVVSFGETRPLVLTEQANRENRRTVTEVKGFFQPGRSGTLDGKYAVRIYNEYVGISNTTGIDVGASN